MDDQNRLPEERRRAAFKDLLEAQDRGVGVKESRALVAKNYGLTAEEVVAIEREGIDEQWPPLE